MARWKHSREIRVYLDDGRIFKYTIPDDEAGSHSREHSAAIVKDGYRHNDGTRFEHYGPHRILKVRVVGERIFTQFTDESDGT